MTPPDLSPPRNIGISISESPDMQYFGFTDGHLKDAMAGFAIHLLASGANLAYGGDLRDRGFTRLIFDLVLRYRPHREKVPPVANYLAWPVHATMTAKDIRALDEELQGFARLVLVGLDGSTMSCDGHRSVQPDTMNQDKWCVGLTAMRELMREQTDARLVLGGKLEGYKGAMPGIAEEALLAIGAKQPVFLIGAFGGCARDIAETLGLVDPWAGSLSTWEGRESFSGYTAGDLNNGLTPAENRQLASTQHVDQAITLVMIGLRRLRTTEGPERPGQASQANHAKLGD